MSTSAKTVNIAVEGDHDAAVAQKLMDSVGLEAGSIYVANGKGNLDKRLPSYNKAAQHERWLVLRDLDQHKCAMKLRDNLVPQRAPHMCLRIIVRSLESWLLADREAISNFLRVPVDMAPAEPELPLHPKQELVNLARRSRSRDIREDMVPAPGAGISVGRGYTARIIEFASDHWNPKRAEAHSDSLKRCLRALRSWR